MKKINLLDFNKSMMENFFLNLGEKKFVADQIMYWIYKKFCFNFFMMHNISKKIRKKLYCLSKIKLPKIFDIKYSVDGVIKFILDVNNDLIETVYIPEKKRKTLCISSQVGCTIKCSFCATGKMKFKRNLLVSEIIGQVLLVINFLKNKIFFVKDYNKYITNIVFMGMGEPLLNFNNVVNSINIMIDCFYFSKRKIVISTSGIVPSIYKLIGIIDIVVTLSLHAPNNILRSKIMSINNIYNLHDILKAMNIYIRNSKSNKGKLNIEYIMLNNINDSFKYANQLVNLLKDFSVKINLIPYNNINNGIYTKSSNERILLFHNFLKKKNIFSFIRKTRGSDINASCGQLYK